MPHSLEVKKSRPARTAKRLLALVTLLFGLSAAAQGAPESGGHLRIGQGGEPSNLDSRIDPHMYGIVILNQIQEGLLAKDLETAVTVPGLAEDWTVSDDGTTYTFELRQGVSFHDGTEFTSEDVLYTFEYLTGEREGGIYVSQYAPMIERIEAPDPHTFVVELVSPWEDFEALLVNHWATKILSKDAVEAAGSAYGHDTPPIGTGPFRFVEWDRGSDIKLERNADYWQAGLPYLDRISYLRIPDGPARILSVRSGDSDIAFAPPLDQLTQVTAQDPNVSAVCAPGNPISYVTLNTGAPPFDDVRVRHAFSLAIDREELVAAVYGEHGEVAYDMFPGWHWLHDAEFNATPHDKERAQELLAEAGYGPSNPLSFELNPTNQTEFRDLAIYIQAQLAEVGVNVTITPMEIGTLVSYRETDEWKADVARLALPSTVTDDYMFKQYHSAGPLNFSRYNKGGAVNERAEELLNSARVSTKEEAEWQYRELVELITEDAPILRIAFPSNCQLARSAVQDLKVQGTDAFPLTGVWLEGGR